MMNPMKIYRILIVVILILAKHIRWAHIHKVLPLMGCWIWREMSWSGAMIGMMKITTILNSPQKIPKAHKAASTVYYEVVAGTLMLPNCAVPFAIATVLFNPTILWASAFARIFK
jgi:hypothetical protein